MLKDLKAYTTKTHDRTGATLQFGGCAEGYYDPRDGRMVLLTVKTEAGDEIEIQLPPDTARAAATRLIEMADSWGKDGAK